MAMRSTMSSAENMAARRSWCKVVVYVVLLRSKSMMAKVRGDSISGGSLDMAFWKA